MSFRRIVSLVTTLSFVMMAYTGIMLFLSPQGRVANWANWTLWGLGKDDYSAVHINFMVVFLIASILHIYLNWACLVSYLRNAARRLVVVTPEFLLALGLTVVVFVGTLLAWPPFRNLVAFNGAVKASWIASYGEPPYGHAELSTLSQFARYLGIPPDDALARLRAGGLRVDDVGQTVDTVARRNGVPPQRVYDVLRPVGPAGQSANKLPPPGAGSGLGRKTLAELEREGLIRLPIALERLKARGVEAGGDSTLKEVAGELGVSPHDLLHDLQ
ncbi:MAG: DUF4405 domain-containing protein [Acidobacteria bacterium]|nr:DUF4405 domain-containing protein [Acidobacteriota bacterium]